jgi:hypothetical protein
MGVTTMRFLIVVAAAALFLLPAIAPVKVFGSAYAAEAAKEKPKKPMMKKMGKKTTKKKGKVEYMRAAPM